MLHTVVSMVTKKKEGYSERCDQRERRKLCLAGGESGRERMKKEGNRIQLLWHAKLCLESVNAMLKTVQV